MVSADGLNRLDLAGEWKVRLDPEDVGIEQGWAGKSFETSIKLPVTTDDAG